MVRAAVQGNNVFVVGGANFSPNCTVFAATSQEFSFCTPMTIGRGQLGAAAVGCVGVHVQMQRVRGRTGVLR